MTKALPKALPKAVGIQLQHTSITEQVVALGQAVTLVPPSSIDEAKNTVVNAEANALLQHVQAGICYQYLKAELPHGEYEAFLKQIDVSPRRANERTTVANLFQKLTDSNRRTSADLDNVEDQLELQNVPFSKMLALSKLNDQLLEKMPITDIQTMLQAPTRALNSEVKQLNLTLDEQDNVQAENERLKAKVKELDFEYKNQITINNHEQLKKAPETLYGIHAEVAYTREQSVIMGELLSTLNTELNHHVQRCTNSTLDPQIGRDCAIALYSTVGGSIMQLAKQLETLANSHGHDFLANPENTPLFDPDQVAEALSKADLVKGPFLATLGK